MKKIFSAIILVSGLFGTVSSLFADQYVNGYFRKDGTYVQPHYRSSPNSTRMDNYSTQGNYNPYTGEYGHKKAKW